MLKEQTISVQSIKRLEKILEAEPSLPRLVSSTGEEILLPEPVYQALCQVVEAMATGQEISIVPLDKEMTTQEAADILNVSRPHLIEKLLDTGEIPYIMVGTHRRIRSQDLMAYKKQRDTIRRQILGEFTAFLEEEGFYDEDSKDNLGL